MKKNLPRLKKIEVVLELILKNPSRGSHTISAKLPKIKGKPLLSNHGVYKILVKLDLETRKKRRAFVRLNKRLGRKTASEILGNWFALAGKKRLSAQERLTMISRVGEGEPVKASCSFFGVSRKNFYKWNKRYRQAPAAKKEIALFDKKPEILKYWRQIPEEQEKRVLEIVSAYPELSAHKIVQVLPRVLDKPVIGNHGVQNILRRNKLSTFEARLAYQKAYLPVKPEFVPAEFQPIFNLPLRILRMAISPFATIPKKPGFKIGSLLFLFTFVLSTFSRFWLQMYYQAPQENRIGLIFATISIICGTFFFLYSMKYYLTLAIVLGFSRHVGGNGRGINGNHNNHNNNSNGKLLWLTRFFGGNGNGNGNGRGYTGGLQPNLDHIKLERFPFVSIHLPVYNEKKVVNRLLTACTSMDYKNYEVVVVDDSTDGTIRILEDWRNHPRVKIIHRESRAGFKGGALQVALENTDKRAEFVLVFDADFIPYPDTITQFLKYFQSIVGSLTYSDSKIAAIQGYQWHVLNKSENWITRGVRSEYAGNYVVERSGAEVLGALKQIAGSVYMIRADLLKTYGWGTSITEDFELTLRLYQDGYKVIYTPYLQAPSECVAILKRLVRQRMRWAEGHSYNIRKMVVRLLSSPNLTLIEKLEFLYLSPYYLQATLFLIGTLSWFISETVFRARLPFWTSLWGWSLVLTNMLSLPLMNTVGLFLEESEEKDYLGIASFVFLSYLLVPFQAYASVKGFLEKEEGPWFRTPKTGKITDVFTRGRFYRWISGIIPGRRPAPVLVSQLGSNPYLSLATANNRFNNFAIRPKRLRWVGNFSVVAVSLLTIALLIGTPLLPLVVPASASQIGFKSIGNLTPPTESEISREEITNPLNLTYQGPSESLEYIFHPEPRVRVKLGSYEIETTVVASSSLGRPSPSSAYKEGITFTYEEIFEGIDLVFKAENGKIEEHFVFNKYKEFDSIDESVRLVDLVMAKIEDEIQIAPAEGGHPIFYFPRPYMYEKGNPQVKSEGLEYQLEKEQFGWKLKKVLTSQGKAWLSHPLRQFPVIIDPTLVKSTVTTALAAGEVEFGSAQRKIAFSATAGTDSVCTSGPCPSWYVITEAGDDISYQRCLQSSGCDEDGDWSAKTDIDDDGTADHGNSSIYRQSDSRLWVAWIDDKGVDPDDTLHFRYIDTTTAFPHTLGTHCESTDQGSLDNTDAYAYIAASGNNDVVVGYSSRAADVEADIFEAPLGACTFTSIETGSGLPTGSQTFFVVPTVIGNNVFLIYNDAGGNNDTRVSVRDTGTDTWDSADVDVDGVDNYNVLTFSATSDGTDIWLLVLPGATTAPDLFRCGACVDTAPSFSDVNDPFGTPTNAEDIALTYVSSGNYLKAFILRDTTQQVYANVTDADTISWGTEFSLGYTAQDMNDLSSVYSVTNVDDIGVVVWLVTPTDYEFSTVPENLWVFLLLSPFLPQVLKKLKKRRK